MSVNFAAHKSQ